MLAGAQLLGANQSQRLTERHTPHNSQRTRRAQHPAVGLAASSAISGFCRNDCGGGGGPAGAPAPIGPTAVLYPASGEMHSAERSSLRTHPLPQCADDYVDRGGSESLSSVPGPPQNQEFPGPPQIHPKSPTTEFDRYGWSNKGGAKCGARTHARGSPPTDMSDPFGTPTRVPVTLFAEPWPPAPPPQAHRSGSASKTAVPPRWVPRVYALQSRSAAPLHLVQPRACIAWMPFAGARVSTLPA
jgi:hypothetical protein